MVLNDCQKLYPICDTDMWVKISRFKKIKGIELILNNYEAIFIPDAVLRELFREDREEYIDDFKCGQKNFSEQNKNGNIHIMRLSNKDMFDDDIKKYILRLFTNNKIYYDEVNGKFIGTIANVGERVAIIYAVAHDLKIILSDDGHSKTFIDSRFPDFDSNVLNVTDILRINGYKGDALFNLRKDINLSFSDIEAAKDKPVFKLSTYRKNSNFKFS